jgi:hypothetical protein
MRKGRENFQEETVVADRAAALEQADRDNEIKELREVLADQKVRKFLWRMMAKASMFQTHFNQNAAIMGHKTGMADMGTAILNEILEANPEAWIVMQQDAYQKQIDAAIADAAEQEKRSKATE